MSDSEQKDRDKTDKTKSLSERIAQFEAKTTPNSQKRKSSQLPAAGVALAGRVATELVAGIAVGAFLGWLIDKWLGTTPAFMLVLFFLGAAGGVMNIWRLLTGRGMGAGYFGDHRENKD
ncbi:MAG: AtpZ/AtpI family protein [Alphaproteobacteria bacterium]|nr:AtpZ/AtpI family protein [Alphaproteobacteria bacterium]MBT5799233.1 AtpZ/AtpI family protein [Alphaproteobacteria bacterium]MDC3311906.1 AtpZ/AtpI family protein [Alphaproteobacteria bacterium]